MSLQDPPPDPHLLAHLHQLCKLLEGRRLCALTGAGCSTDSGIPDYRSPQSLLRTRKPIQFLEFVRDPAARQRYWARSFAGWPRFGQARPNAAHLALAALEQEGVLGGLITQNVDGLHTRAGHRALVELHGALSEVVCLDCAHVFARQDIQRLLERLNPQRDPRMAEPAPDGDAVLEARACQDFVVPDCPACQGMLKPHVVLFGENVPGEVLARAWQCLQGSEVLLVAGSSLHVFSGYRFVREATRRQMPVVIVNLGPTRGDAEATVRLDAPVGAVLPWLAQHLGRTQATT